MPAGHKSGVEYLNMLKENLGDEFEYDLSIEDDESDDIDYDAIDDNCD